MSARPITPYSTMPTTAGVVLLPAASTRLPVTTAGVDSRYEGGGDISRSGTPSATAAAAALLVGCDITAVAISPPPSYRESTPAVVTGSRVLAAGNSNGATPVVVGMVL